MIRTYIYNISLYIVMLAAVLLSTQTVTAADSKTTAESVWQQGVEAYTDKEYDRAVECFEQVVALGYGSADVYYNLGDAYFKRGQHNISGTNRPFAAGELGKAIINYYRALRLEPSMKDARYNLDLARDHTNDTEAVPQALLTRAWYALRDTMSSNGWAVISVVVLVVTLLLVLLYLLSSRVVLRKVAFFVAIVTTVVFVVTTILALSQRAAYLNDERAVVMCNDTTPVHASPDSSSKIVRQPSQGVTVDVVREHGEWSEIEFADGEKGWIRTTAIERI